MGIIEKQVVITLTSIIILAAIGVGYVLIEPYWRAERGQQMLEHSAQAGKALFETQGCIQCHLQNGYGILQGGVGWPLNTTQNQRGSASEMEARRQLLIRTIDRGRGAVMAPYGRDNGGPFNAEQIDNLVDYIQHGQWPVAPVEGEAAVLVQQAQQGGVPAAGGASKGAQLFAANGCSACHMIKGQGGSVGPNLSNIGNDAAKLVPGQSAAEYLRTSITNPNAFIVPGYQPGIMPQTFGTTLKPDEIDALVQYLLEQKQ